MQIRIEKSVYPYFNGVFCKWEHMKQQVQRALAHKSKI